MGRDVTKDVCIDKELELAIKQEFPKLMRYYDMAGLRLPVPVFYAVMRGEPCRGEHVREVEMGLVQARTVADMTPGELLTVLQGVGAAALESADIQGLRAIVGRVLASGAGS